MNHLDFIFNNKIFPINRVRVANLYKHILGRFFHNPFTEEMIKKKVLFVHIPKTGGSSVATALIGKPTGHPYLYEFYLADKKYTKEFFKFCVVRNPYDRLVSAYSYIALRDCPRQYKDVFKILEIDSFSDLIHCLEDDKKRTILTNNIIHFRPQYELIKHSKVKMDAIYRFEEFASIEVDLNTKLSTNISIEKLNTSPRSDYKDYFNKDAICIVKAVYAEDLDKFNYQF